MSTCVSGPSMILQRGKQPPQILQPHQPPFSVLEHSLGQAPDLRLLSPWEASRDFSRISQKKRDENPGLKDLGTTAALTRGLLGNEGETPP